MKVRKHIDGGLGEVEILVNCRTEAEFQKIFSKLDDRLSLDTVDGLWRLSQAELVYLEVVGNYLELHTVTEQVYRIRSPLYKFLSKLSDDFIQISRSYVINFEQLNSVEADVINGLVARVGLADLKVPISRTYLKNIKRKVAES